MCDGFLSGRCISSPGLFARGGPRCAGLPARFVNWSARLFVVLHGPVFERHGPFVAGEEGVEAEVDKHAEAGFPPPGHAFVACGGDRAFIFGLAEEFCHGNYGGEEGMEFVEEWSCGGKEFWKGGGLGGGLDLAEMVEGLAVGGIFGEIKRFERVLGEIEELSCGRATDGVVDAP